MKWQALCGRAGMLAGMGARTLAQQVGDALWEKSHGPVAWFGAQQRVEGLKFGDRPPWLSCLTGAKVHGEFSLAELESIIEAGIVAKHGQISTDNSRDSIDAPADIEVNDGLMEEQKDAEFLRSMRRAAKVVSPNLGTEAVVRLMRAVEREKAAESAPHDPRKAAEEEAATREVLSKRTFVQNMFAGLGRVRRTRPRIK